MLTIHETPTTQKRQSKRFSYTEKKLNRKLKRWEEHLIIREIVLRAVDE